MSATHPALPFPPRMMRRPQAAAYVGVGATKFDAWVAQGLMPRPVRRDACVLWDRLALDLACDRMSDAARAAPDTPDPWEARL